ncbi:flagellar basal body-associated FliL family protein [Hydrogenophaga sp.]|uniref:flagellar basal body-associated FliL family protein n=1 Tax=Hydrogenophaga sp. TaxID=1904254 RepID=UPI0026109FD3|nr:flagellar basal body-associated FliL family protein [Hydrogenophaga sp.]MCW5654302.1 flagellar basal body-associated FliL family protein [Hydrogenophaga sp.]
MSAAAAATATAEAPEAPKKKSRKLLFIIVGVLVLALAGAGGALFILKKNTAESHGDEEAVAEQSHKSRTPPTFLPLDNMVVNLADAGGNRFVQLGLTLQLQDAKTGDDMKAYMPSIRSQILVLISQRTADEMLQVQGKEKLAADIVEVISHEMGYGGSKPGSKGAPNPVQAVRFSSFIVQ